MCLVLSQITDHSLVHKIWASRVTIKLLKDYVYEI